MTERNRMRLRVFGPPTRQKPRGLRLDRHLNSQSSGTWCRHPPRHSAREVKNKIPLEFELPPDVVRILELYLQKFRLLLATDGSSYLFPARRGGAKTPLGAAMPTTFLASRNDRKALQSGAEPRGITAAQCHARRSPGSLNTRCQEIR
jgi:hypothetical protein